MIDFAKDRERHTGSDAHLHVCRVKRAPMLGMSEGFDDTHTFACFGTTDAACKQTQVQCEMGCLMEEEIRRLGGNVIAVLDRWEKEIEAEPVAEQGRLM